MPLSELLFNPFATLSQPLRMRFSTIRELAYA